MRVTCSNAGARRRWSRVGALTAALLATGAGAGAQAASLTFTHETTKGASCSIRVYATRAATTTYGIASERCDTKRGVRHISGGSVLLRENGQILRDTAISGRSHLPFRLEATYSGSVQAGFHRSDFSVVLRSPQTRRPERWRRRSVPPDCAIGNTDQNRDTLICGVQTPVTAG